MHMVGIFLAVTDVKIFLHLQNISATLLMMLVL